MKSKTHLQSSKNIRRSSLDMIHQRCKQDHFFYTKQLPIKKNLSSYTSAYKQVGVQGIIQNTKIQAFRRKIAPPSLDPCLLKRSLHQSSFHYSPNKVVPLPNLKIDSTYKSNFLQKSNQKIQKGKQQDGFFIKMPWHDSPTSNYKKSYDNSFAQMNSVEKGKAVEDHLKIMKRSFKGVSNYQECYSPLGNSKVNDSSECIKNKDHIRGVNCSLKGKSEYKSRYEKQNKQNGKSEKSIAGKKGGLLPQIKQKRSTHHQQNLPKRSIKMKKTKSNPVGQEMITNSTHERIFGVVVQN